MKKLITAACVVSLAVLCGCKTVPTTETMYTTSYACGLATGLITNMTKIDDTSRNAIISIMNQVVQCIPETNQTFEAAWTPIAKAHVQALINAGKINEAQGNLILAAFNLVVKGIDYIFEVRFPQAKQYKDLTIAAIDGFSYGFLTVFKPVNGLRMAPATYYNYDQGEYDYLKSQLK